MPRLTCLLLGLAAGAVLADTPAYVLQLPAEVTTVLVAETDTATLYRYTQRDGRLELAGKSYMSIGEQGVGKERAWDRRTPLGLYFINDRLDTARMHDRYGPMAFPLDYPNPWDRQLGRGGDGIWLHGVDPAGGRRPALDTDGCLAVPNEDLVALEPYLQVLQTPVIVTRRLEQVSADAVAEARARLAGALQVWERSFRDGDWQTYLDLYATDFEYRGLDRENWSAYRVRSAATRPLVDFRVDEVVMLADPEEEGLYLSRFRQTITDGEGTIRTTKRLYWRRGSGGALTIVAEDNG
jgi:murein L,D-transpeptidase YafK